MDAMNAYGPDSFYALAEYDTLPRNVFDSLGFHVCDCEFASINELNPQAVHKIYPNPVINDVLHIESSQRIWATEVVNIVGQTILFNRNKSTSKQMDVRIQGLDKGLYLVKIYASKNNYTTRKIIVE